MKAIVFFLIATASFVSHAQTTCHIDNIMRCLCPANVHVVCDDGREGYIDNKTKITSLTLRTVGDVGIAKEITLPNPPGGVGDYIAPKDNPWIKSQLSAQDIDHVQEANGKVFTIDGKAKLFADSNENEVAKQDKASPDVGVSEGYRCLKTDPEQIIGNGCTMRVFCTKGSEGGDNVADCAKPCPATLQACLNDNSSKGSERGSKSSGSAKSTKGVQ